MFKNILKDLDGIKEKLQNELEEMAKMTIMLKEEGIDFLDSTQVPNFALFDRRLTSEAKVLYYFLHSVNKHQQEGEALNHKVVAETLKLERDEYKEAMDLLRVLGLVIYNEENGHFELPTKANVNAKSIKNLSSLLPYKPDKEISDCNRHKRKGHADLHKLAVFDFIAVFLQNADCRDIGRSADRGDVAPEGRSREQSEVQKIRLNSEDARKPGDDRKHGRHIRDIVDKSGRRDGSPHNQRVEQEEAAASHLCEDARNIIDDAGLGQSLHDHEEAEQKAQRHEVHALQGLRRRFRAMFFQDRINQTNRRKWDADESVCHPGLLRYKGSPDQHEHRSQQKKSRNKIPDGRDALRRHGPAVFPEEEHHDDHRTERSQLYGPENARFAVHPEEIQEVHSGIAAQHNGRGVADESRGALQIWGNRDTDQHRDRGNPHLFGDRQSHRRQHEHSRDIIHKGGYDTRKNGHKNDYPHDVSGLLQNHVRDPVGHLRFDKEVDRDHRAGDHQKDIPVDGGRHRFERNNAGHHKNDSWDQGREDSLLRHCNHQDICQNK